MVLKMFPLRKQFESNECTSLFFLFTKSKFKKKKSDFSGFEEAITIINVY